MTRVAGVCAVPAVSATPSRRQHAESRARMAAALVPRKPMERVKSHPRNRLRRRHGLIAGLLAPARRTALQDICRRGRCRNVRIAPCLRAAMAQPEDAGLDVGRIVDGAGQGLEVAADDGRSLDLAIIAHGTVVKAVRHPGIGNDAAAASRHRRNRHAWRSIGRPCWMHVEKFGELVVGGAEQAVVVRLLAHFRVEAAGRPIAVIELYITPVRVTYQEPFAIAAPAVRVNSCDF